MLTAHSQVYLHRSHTLDLNNALVYCFDFVSFSVKQEDENFVHLLFFSCYIFVSFFIVSEKCYLQVAKFFDRENSSLAKRERKKEKF